MAITRVQGNSSGLGSSATTIAVTLGAPVGNGNCICGTVAWQVGATLTSVTDDKGNTYNLETTVVGTDGGATRHTAFSRTNITNAPITITATFSASSVARLLVVDEFAGTSNASNDARDGSAHGGREQAAPGTATDAIDSGSFTTTVHGDLLYGACLGAPTTTFASNGTGFSTGTQNNAVYAIQSEYRTQATAGAGTAATFTQAVAARRSTFLIAIKGAAITLSATGLTVSSPVFGTPAYTKNAYNFIAATREFSPVIDAAVLKQKQIMIAAGLTVGRPFIQIPGLTGLTGMGIGVGSPVFGAPILTHPWGLYTPIPTVSAQITEAGDLLNLVLDGLIKAVPTRIGGGRPAWDFRRQIGIVRAYGRQMIYTGTLGEPLVACFNFATAAKASFEGYERLRRLIIEQVPFSLPAQATAHLAVQCTLAQMAFITSTTVYRSRDQALTALTRISEAYAPAEDDVADEADPMMYRALVAARAAAVRDLAARGRQLPRVIEYQFATPMTGLWITHRLYDDAARFEELRDENDWIHPAFCPAEGHYLSRHLG